MGEGKVDLCCVVTVSGVLSEIEVAEKDEVVEFLGVGTVKGIRFLGLCSFRRRRRGISSAEFRSHQHDSFGQASRNLNRGVRLERVNFFALNGGGPKVADIVILVCCLLRVVNLLFVFML